MFSNNLKQHLLYIFSIILLIFITNCTSDAGSGSLTPTAISQKTLTSLAILPANATLPAGTSKQLIAIGTYSDNSTENLTNQVLWDTSDTTIANVGNDSTKITKGIINSLKLGVTTINVSLNGINGSTKLNVNDATLLNIVVANLTSVPHVGITQNLYASGLYSDNTIHDISSQVTWGSSNESIAKINGMQLIPASAGNVIISATLNGVTGNNTFTINPASLQNININVPNTHTPQGITEKLTATGIYSDSTTQDISQQVAWSSLRESVATISNALPNYGVLTPILIGTTTISATLNGVSQTTLITVESAILQSIAINQGDTNIPLGLTESLTATGTFSNGTQQDITQQVVWSSADNSIATISNVTTDKGVVNTLKQGSVTISASLNNISTSNSVTVNSPSLVSVVATPTNISTMTGFQKKLAVTGIYSNGSTQDVTNSVFWNVSNPSLATISANTLTSNNSGSGTISATYNGKFTSIPLTINQYVYVAGTSTLGACKLSNNAMTNCESNVLPSGASLNGGGGISFYNNYAYIVSQSTSSITYCKLSESDGHLTNCNTQNDSTLSKPVGISVINNYAYIANWGNSTVTYCSIDSNTESLIYCRATGNGFNGSAWLSSATVAGQSYMYISNANNKGNNQVSECAISYQGLSNCNNYTESNVDGYIEAIGIYNGYIYSTSKNTTNPSVCQLSGIGLLSSSCQNVISSYGTNSLDIAFNNNYAYITNTNGTVSTCQIQANGTFLSCTTNSSIVFIGARGITIR